MQIEFAGAAREVTASCHILRVNGRTVLLDYGMFAVQLALPGMHP
jgi:metallo-beta-lactamase family protein